MTIEDGKAAKIQELLKELSKADTFQSVEITRQIREVATENVERENRSPTAKPAGVNPPQSK